eukprot:809670-Pyramimonas_sp.AAC.1
MHRVCGCRASFGSRRHVRSACECHECTITRVFQETSEDSTYTVTHSFTLKSRLFVVTGYSLEIPKAEIKCGRCAHLYSPHFWGVSCTGMFRGDDALTSIASPILTLPVLFLKSNVKTCVASHDIESVLECWDLPLFVKLGALYHVRAESHVVHVMGKRRFGRGVVINNPRIRSMPQRSLDLAELRSTLPHPQS